MKTFLLITFLSMSVLAKSADYKGLTFLDENIKIGIGLSYSKLENSSTVGNYFLLSESNPRLEFQYDSPTYDRFTNRFLFNIEQLVYRPENNSLILKYAQSFYSYGFGWRPRWISEGEGFAYGFQFGAKSTAAISELPDPFNVQGDIATRFSGEAGVAFVWFGQTVAKLPLSIDFELLYSGTLGGNTLLVYKEGIIYRFGIEFDFGKRSVLTNWNVRAFYSFENIRNNYANFVDKEIGVMLNKVFYF